MHQQTLALAAVVLDDKTLSKQWLDHDFKMGNDNSVGGNILGVFVNLVDRDGYGYEAAPGYNNGWLSDFLGIAELLKGYRIGGDGESFDLYENVKFKKMIYSFIDLTISNKFTPSIGDSGKTGYSGLSVNIDNLIKGYLQYGDPYLAQAIYLVNKETTEGLKTGIFDKDPESLGERIDAVVKEKGTIKVDSVNLTGYGYACVKGFSDNDPGGEAVSYPKSAVYDFASLEVLNGTVMTGVVKNDGYVSFTPDEVHNAASFCFYLDNIRSVYEITFKAVGTGNDSKAAVYIDGKCIQDSVSFKENEGKEFTVFIKRTLELSKGFHMVTFDSLTGDEIRLVSMSVRRSANSSSEGSIVDHNKETAVYMYYGKSTAHGHFDNLNLALYSYDVDMMPDLGYPEFTDAYDMHRRYLVDHTISHNTVMVDNRAQGDVNVAIPVLYDSSDLVKLISVESPKVYPGLKDYRRTTAAIKCGDGEYYLADFFTVKGGSNHKYILHGAESSSVDTAGITLKAQEGGTLLNEKGEYGKPNDASGMQWFRNVKRGENPENGFTVDWSVVDTWGYATAQNIHLKVTLLGDYDKATLADATPPSNKPGNPEALTYLFVEREGKDLASMFNSVIEPYAGESKISSVCEVPVYEKGGKTDVTSEYLKACKVELVNGRVDYIVYNGGDTNKMYTVADVFDFTGSFAVYTVNGENTVIYTNDAYVNGKEDNVRGITGKVTDFTKELTDKNYITVSLNKDIDPEKLAGQYVYIDKYFEASYNGCFEIVSAEKLSDGKYSLYIGDVTLAEAFASSSDVNGGYKYSIAVNAGLYIPFAYTAGDADSLFKVKAEKVFSTLTLSHSMKKDSAKGDYVGTIFPVYENVRASKDMKPYSLKIVSDFKDGKLFELRDGNKLYLALDPGERALGTEFAVRFEITAEGGAAESFDIGIPMLTKNASDKLVYPSFSLERTAPSSEDEVSEGEGEEQGEEPSGSITWIIIIAAVLAVIAGAAVFVIIKKKGNKA